MKFFVWLSAAILLSAGFGKGAHAQTWDELFRQKETQQEYLLLQIGALRLQSGLLKEASQIASFGLNAIQTWRGFEKEFHEEFFSSFKRIGPLSSQAREKLLNSGNQPATIRARILKSRNNWMSRSSDRLFLLWSDRIHQGLLSRCEEYAIKLDLVFSESLELSDGDRSNLMEELKAQLLELNRDLSSVQQASRFRLAQQNYRDFELQLLNRF